MRSFTQKETGGNYRGNKKNEEGRVQKKKKKKKKKKNGGGDKVKVGSISKRGNI